MIITLKLPWPPSTNSYYRVVNNRAILSAKARDYRTVVEGLFGGGAPLTGRLGVVIYAFPPDRRARDLDNLLKQPLDALQSAGVFLNDSQIDQLMIRRQPCNPAQPYLLVTIDDGDSHE